MENNHNKFNIHPESFIDLVTDVIIDRTESDIDYNTPINAIKNGLELSNKKN